MALASGGLGWPPFPLHLFLGPHRVAFNQCSAISALALSLVNRGTMAGLLPGVSNASAQTIHGRGLNTSRHTGCG